jgi:hypothetical protein
MLNAVTKLAPRAGSDWTDEEQTEIQRLKSACGRVDYWELECNHTDAGDPWCIIYDLERDGVVLHIARIDRRYVTVFPMQKWSVWSATPQAAIDRALRAITFAPIHQDPVSRAQIPRA